MASSSFRSEFDGIDDFPRVGDAAWEQRSKRNRAFSDSELREVGDASSSAEWEQRGQVYELVLQANRAFRESRLEEAISLYSKALKLQPKDPIILNNRSAAFCCYSQQLRNRPAALSEIQALSGMDPTVHAELALKDAERALKSQSVWPKSYYRKAMALMLLERYGDARESLLCGLQVDPSSIPLQAALSDFNKRMVLGLENTSDRTRRARVQRTDDFDCTLCLKMLYDPVTTPCGHSFCRSCLFQCMDHGNKCPMCRTVLLLSPRTYPLRNFFLRSMLSGKLSRRF